MSILVTAHSTSAADTLGYRGQHAISRTAAARGIENYRIIGGHMVRLLLLAYPTERAVPRSTVDADAGLGDVELVAPVDEHLQADGFLKKAGNTYAKELDNGETLSIDLLVPSDRPQPDLRPVAVPGVGQVDSLPALSLVMGIQPLELTVQAHLTAEESLQYDVKIPGLDMALLLKAAGWKNRRSPKDVTDIATLLEIRHAHPEIPWSLAAPLLRGRRRDAARALYELEALLGRRQTPPSFPAHLDRPRLRALIKQHIAQSPTSR